MKIGHWAESIRISGRAGRRTAGNRNRTVVRIGCLQRGDAVLGTVVGRRIVQRIRCPSEDTQCFRCHDGFGSFTPTIATRRSRGGRIGVPPVLAIVCTGDKIFVRVYSVDFFRLARAIAAGTARAVQNPLTGVLVSLFETRIPTLADHHHACAAHGDHPILRATRIHACFAHTKFPHFTCRGIRGIPGGRRTRVHPPLALSRAVSFAAGAGCFNGTGTATAAKRGAIARAGIVTRYHALITGGAHISCIINRTGRRTGVRPAAAAIHFPGGVVRLLPSCGTRVFVHYSLGTKTNHLVLQTPAKNVLSGIDDSRTSILAARCTDPARAILAKSGTLLHAVCIW